jgi:hypothetical protein
MAIRSELTIFFLLSSFIPNHVILVPPFAGGDGQQEETSFAGA